MTPILFIEFDPTGGKAIPDGLVQSIVDGVLVDPVFSGGPRFLLTSNILAVTYARLLHVQKTITLVLATHDQTFTVDKLGIPSEGWIDQPGTNYHYDWAFEIVDEQYKIEQNKDNS